MNFKTFKIKTARKKIAKWHEYLVCESGCNWGEPYRKMSKRHFRGSCAEHALKRALKNWAFFHHRFHDDDSMGFPFTPTNKKWGEFEVKDCNTGFSYYFK